MTEHPMRTIFLVLTSTILLAACSGPDNQLGFREVSPGPGDRAVTPADPLEIPPTRELAPPTPGGTNLADPG